jgi:secretion/DNA translocation related TadE-like protein
VGTVGSDEFVTPSRRIRRIGCERGSVTVVAAAVIGMAVILCMAAADLARVLVVAQAAKTAADAAALGAAQELALPSAGTDPTAVASDYAARNGATLIDCACDVGSFEADVQVIVPVGPLLIFGDGRSVTAQARAVVDVPAA